MMQINPTIIVKHLVAKKDDEIAYTEKFHYGLNVFYGANGGGKTSIIQLLMYSLGYNITNWKVEAKSCTVVYSEIELNGSTVTFKRNINKNEENEVLTQQSLEVCFFPISQAMDTSLDNWYKYPYSISQNKESFSQKIFSLLDMPEVKLDEKSNMTLHQIFRLIYSEQSTPARFIFNNEDFDSGLKREIIGDYLLGLHDNTLYNTKIKLHKAERKLERLTSELNAMNRILNKSDILENIENIEEYLFSLEKENIEINQKILFIKESQVLDYKKENKSINELAKENVKLKQELFNMDSKINNLTYDIKDSELFIDELNYKLEAINESIQTQSIIKNINFDICPSCFSKLENTSKDYCNLCGKEHPEEQLNINLLRMKNELELQINESKRLLTRKKEKLLNDKKIKSKTNSLLKRIINKIIPTYSSVNTAKETELFESYQQLGENQEKIDTYRKLKSLYDEVRRLTKDKEDIKDEIEGYIKIIERQERLILSRSKELNILISEIMCRLLKQDSIGSSNEELEDKFKSAKQVKYDFASNAIVVDGKSIFSESSMFLLNNLFHLAILIASTQKEYMRFPRLLILDGIENGGMSDARSRNFQKIVKKETDKITTKFQVFIATRSLYEELNDVQYLAGQELTSTNKSLKV